MATRTLDELAARAIHAIRALTRDTPDVVVACSGGADSIALLHLAVRAGLEPHVVHVHHHLRPDADHDADRARRAAERLGLPFTLTHLDPDALRADPAGLEAASRSARYRVLAAIARGRLVLTAHHRDDRVETFLLRAAHGAGLRALAALRDHQRLPELELRRPLLDLRADDLRAWLREQGIDWAEDSTNHLTDRPRTALRNRHLPALRETFGADAFASTLRAIDQDARALDWLLDRATGGARLATLPGLLVLHAASLRPLPDPVLRAWFARELSELHRLRHEAHHLDALVHLVHGPGRRFRAGGLSALRIGGQLRLGAPDAVDRVIDAPATISLAIDPLDGAVVTLDDVAMTIVAAPASSLSPVDPTGAAPALRLPFGARTLRLVAADSPLESSPAPIAPLAARARRDGAARLWTARPWIAFADDTPIAIVGGRRFADDSHDPVTAIQFRRKLAPRESEANVCP